MYSTVHCVFSTTTLIMENLSPQLTVAPPYYAACRTDASFDASKQVDCTIVCSSDTVQWWDDNFPPGLAISPIMGNLFGHMHNPRSWQTVVPMAVLLGPPGRLQHSYWGTLQHHRPLWWCHCRPLNQNYPHDSAQVLFSCVSCILSCYHVCIDLPKIIIPLIQVMSSCVSNILSCYPVCIGLPR